MDSGNNENNVKAADDLSELLDSALKDFGKAKTTDEELDEIMDGLDREATQKAAKNFQAMLEGMVTVMDQEQQQQAAAGPSGEDAKFFEGLKELMKRSGDLANAPDEKGYLEALSNMEPNPMVDELMGMLAQTLLAKDVMLPVIADVCDKYEPYLQENRATLDEETLERYTAQHKVCSCVFFQIHKIIAALCRPTSRVREGACGRGRSGEARERHRPPLAGASEVWPAPSGGGRCPAARLGDRSRNWYSESYLLRGRRRLMCHHVTCVLKLLDC